MAELRAEFSKGGLEASLLAAQLLEMVEKLQAQLRAAESTAAGALRAVAEHEASALEQRLAAAREGGSACPACGDRAARALVMRLRERASSSPAISPRQGGSAN
jgi:hypothetical protein